jgi:hypothetical protein
MKIICDNQRGEQIVFGDAAPLWLLSVEGLGSEFNIYTSKSSGQDGENFNGSDAGKRNLVLSLEVKRGDFGEQSERLYRFFQKGAPGICYCDRDSGAMKKIEYYVEKVQPDNETFSPGGNYPGETRVITVSLLCPDPKFYAVEDELTQLAVWQGCIQFPLQLRVPFAVTRKINNLIGNVHNDGTVPMGLTVRFTASGTVVNPSLYDINRHELMQINTTMHSGDIILVTTGENNKRVKCIAGGITSNINNRMAYPPCWLKAYEGDNLFRYNADSGIDSLSVSILSTPAYWGA